MTAPESNTKAQALCQQHRERGLNAEEVAELVACAEKMILQLGMSRQVIDRLLPTWSSLRDDMNSLWGMLHPQNPGRDPFDNQRPARKRRPDEPPPR